MVVGIMRPSTVVRSLPIDMKIISVFTLLATGAAIAPGVSDSPIRLVLGFVYVFFVPGYVLTAVLFPRTSEPVPDEFESLLGPIDRNFTGLERGCLSVGLSIPIVALLALLISASPFALSLVVLLVALGGFTLLGTAVATRRRLRLPEENRFELDLRSGWREAIAGAAEIRSDRIINVLLLLSVLLASASIAYAATTPRDNQEYTRFYLLSGNGGGELVADNYTAGPNGTGDVVVGIENHEYERVNYSTVVLLRPVTTDGTSTTAEPGREVLRYDTTLSHNETGRTRVDVPPTDRDGDYRLEFLLYRGDVPGDPTAESAYRHTHLLLGASGGEGSEEVTTDA
jgi:uncharacterized membrane protein